MSAENEPDKPDMTALYRVAASHAIECAFDDSTEPHIILDIAQHHFKRMFDKTTNWPDRRILH